MIRRLVAGGLVPLLWLTLLLVIALAAGWPERAIALRIWLVGVGLVGLRMLVDLIVQQPTTSRRDAFDRAAALEAAEPLAPAPSYAEAQRLVELVAGTAGDVHFRVRPVLREIAAHRLVTRRGLVLDDPVVGAEVATCCGPLLWGVVRPDRPEPSDRRHHELDAGAAAELIARLEAI